MNRHKGTQQLFILLLFLIFVLGSFFMLSFGSSAYRNNLKANEETEKYRLPLSYLSTKVKEAENRNSISLMDIEGKSCLVILERVADEDYATIIYYEDGYLYESFQKNRSYDLSYSDKVMATAKIEMEKDGNVMTFRVGDYHESICLY